MSGREEIVDVGSVNDCVALFGGLSEKREVLERTEDRSRTGLHKFVGGFFGANETEDGVLVRDEVSGDGGSYEACGTCDEDFHGGLKLFD